MMQTSVISCPFCDCSNPSLQLDGSRFAYVCCDQLDKEAEQADEETLPFHYLTTSDTPRAALGKWQEMCRVLTELQPA